MQLHKIIIIVIFLCVGFNANSQRYTEYEIKSAYIFNFVKFIDFPENTFSTNKEPFIIGVMGNEALLAVLQDIIKGRTINNRNVIAIGISQIEETNKCQIILFSQMTTLQVRQFLEYLNSKPILTIGDNIEDFCQNGGIINFTPHNSPKRFEININAAKRAKLIISSKLLALARIVSDVENKF